MPSASKSSNADPAEATGQLLITAGPTQEPIDAVRYLGNRSSGRLGVALARSAARAGWDVTLLLGPTSIDASDTPGQVVRFQTAAELESLMDEHFPRCDLLVMAAAVADYRPSPVSDISQTKIRRKPGGLVLHLEATPDLLAGCAERRQPGQRIVGFALEPRDRMMDSAREKLQRKGLDAIVANPLETMDAPTIEATLLTRDGQQRSTPGPIAKEEFATWLLAQLGAVRAMAEQT